MEGRRENKTYFDQVSNMSSLKCFWWMDPRFVMNIVITFVLG